MKPRSVSRRLRLGDLAGLVVVVAGLVVVSRLLGSTPYIDSITFVNPTSYDLDIGVTSEGSRGSTALGTARRNEATTFEEVIDHGGVWIFRFTGQGQRGGELRLSRAHLEREDWRVSIPERVGAELRSKGAVPPP